MDILQLVIDYLGKTGPVGHVLTLAVMLIMAAPAVVTALVALWHAIVAVAAAVEVIVPSAKGLMDRLQADSVIIDSKSNGLLNILNRLSGLKLPQSQAQLSAAGYIPIVTSGAPVAETDPVAANPINPQIG